MEQCGFLFFFNTVALHYTNDYAWYSICSTWFLDIRISTCSINSIYIAKRQKQAEGQTQTYKVKEHMQQLTPSLVVNTCHIYIILL